MGKRELVLIVVFLAVGALVYRLTAPPSTAATGRFSVSELVRHIRDEIRGQNYRLEVRRNVTQPVSAATTRLVIREFRGQLTVTGADSPDLTAELSTDVYGADEPDARGQAENVRLEFEEDGEAVAVAVERPASRRRQQSRLTVRLPARLAVEIQGAGRIEVQNTAGVRLETRLGDVTLRDVAGRVEGEHRDGAFSVTGAGELHLSARRSNVRAEQVRGAVTGEFSDGRLVVRDVAGPVRIETTRAQVDVERTGGELRLTATDGGAVVRQPAGSVTFRGRRCELTVVADAAVAVNASNMDAAVDLQLPRNGGITLDLGAEEGGLVQAEAAGLPVVTEGTTQKATGEVAGGGASWRIRTTRGNIVLRK